MIEFALEQLVTEKYSKVGLWVLNTNENAINFYKKMGFSDTGIFKEENLGEVVTEIFFTKELQTKNISQIYFFYFVPLLYF